MVLQLPFVHAGPPHPRQQEAEDRESIAAAGQMERKGSQQAATDIRNPVTRRKGRSGMV